MKSATSKTILLVLVSLLFYCLLPPNTKGEDIPGVSIYIYCVGDSVFRVSCA